MKISMLCNTLSYNPMIRVYPFAKFLSEDFDIELLGPIDDCGIYPPLRKEDLNFNGDKEKKVYPFYLSTFKRIYKKCDGDVLHVFKTKFYSYGVALLKKHYKKVPIILDIDDWDSQYMMDNFFTLNPVGLSKFLFNDFYIPEGYFSKKFFEQFTKYSDSIITSSYGLARLFGGTCIPSGANTDYFDPAKFSGKKMREKYGIEKDDILVGFTGNPKQHKGIFELVEAVRLARRENEKIKLLIVGASKEDVYNRFIRKLRAMKDIILEDYRPHKEMPSYLAAIDICTIPQRKTPSSMVQMPYKIFEAMAMEKAIISTDVSDVKRTLGDCGTVIKPNDTVALKNAILKYIENKRKRKIDGRKARRKCIKKYSWKVMKKKTLEVYEGIGAI